MASGLDMTQVQAYQDYVQEFSEELLKIALTGFPTAANMTIDDEVKGNKTYTVTRSDNRVLKEHNTTYEGSQHFSLIPRTLSTKLFKAELDIVPSQIRNSYLGTFVLPNMDVMPTFLQHWVGYFTDRLRTDLGEAVWKSDTALVGGGVLSKFDGIIKQIQASVTATELTPTVTGAVTAANVESSIESVYDALADTVKDDTTKSIRLFVPRKIKDLYARKIRIAYQDADRTQVFLLGTDAELVSTPAFAGTSRIAAIPKEDVIVGYDGDLIPSLFVKPDHYQIEHSTQPKIGALLVTPWDGSMAINDQF